MVRSALALPRILAPLFVPLLLTPQFDRCITGTTMIGQSLVPDHGKVAGGLLVVGVDKQHVFALCGEQYGHIGGERRFADTAFYATTYKYHRRTSYIQGFAVLGRLSDNIILNSL